MHGITQHVGHLLLLVLHAGAVGGSEAEYRLVTSLLQKYNRNVRPVADWREALQVKVGLALSQIIDLDERNQLLTTNIWFRLRWSDHKLRWTPADYDGLTSVRLNIHDIWRPDITLYNDIRESRRDIESQFPATVSSDGSVAWNAPTIIKSACLLDVTYFPWDQQRCHLKWGSWTFNGHQLNVTNLSAVGDTSEFIKDGQWELVGVPVRHHVVKYQCCEEPFPDVTFWIVIRRLPLYYIFNLVFPCMFITATTILVFYLPPESGEKVSLGVTVLLALTVFLLLVAETMPPQSQVVPLIAQYFGATIVLMSMSTSITVIVLNLHYRGVQGKPVPGWLKSFCFGCLSRVVFMRGFITSTRAANEHKRKVQPADLTVKSISRTSLLQNGAPPYDDKVSGKVTAGSEQLDKVIEILEEFRGRQTARQRQEALSYEWTLIAMLFDRLFLFIFTLVTVLMTITIMFSEKHAGAPFNPP